VVCLTTGATGDRRGKKTFFKNCRNWVLQEESHPPSSTIGKGETNWKKKETRQIKGHNSVQLGKLVKRIYNPAKKSRLRDHDLNWGGLVKCAWIGITAPG